MPSVKPCPGWSSLHVTYDLLAVRFWESDVDLESYKVEMVFVQEGVM